MNKITINYELLEQVKAKILARPSRLRMSDWLLRAKAGKIVKRERGYGDSTEFRMPVCNTVGCIAGWTVMCGMPAKELEQAIKDAASPLQTDEEVLYMGEFIKSKALDLLAPTNGRNAVQKLFFPTMWYYFTGTTDHSIMYQEAKHQKKRAQIVAEVIDKFIAYYKDIL